MSIKFYSHIPSIGADIEAFVVIGWVKNVIFGQIFKLLLFEQYQLNLNQTKTVFHPLYE